MNRVAVRIEGTNGNQFAPACYSDRVALNPRPRFLILDVQIDSMNSSSGLLFIEFNCGKMRERIAWRNQCRRQ
jgi:hypothetical protein